MATVINFMGGEWVHRNGRHITTSRCPLSDAGNVAVVVTDGHVTSAVCDACGLEDFVVLVWGENDFMPVPAINTF